MTAMCGRYATTMDPETLYGVFGVDPGSGAAALYGGDEPRPRYNIGPTTDNPVVRIRAGGDGAGHRQIELLHWGLVPSWAKDPSVGNRMFNARAESVSDKPAFRRALDRRRCLVPASGFFEWQKVPGTGAKPQKSPKQPFYITPRDGSVMAFAGLWEYWKKAGADAPEAVVSYTILTTEAVGQMQAIHDRMPLILPAADWDTWLDESLDGDAVARLLEPPSPDLVAQLEFRPVDQRVGNVRNDDAAILEPIS